MATTTITNTVTVKGTGSTSTNTDHGSAPVTVSSPSVNIHVTKSVSPSTTLYPGDPLTFTITVTADGSVNSIHVTDNCPTGIIFDSAEITLTGGSASPITITPTLLDYTIMSTLSATVSATITIYAHVDPSIVIS